MIESQTNHLFIIVYEFTLHHLVFVTINVSELRPRLALEYRNETGVVADGKMRSFARDCKAVDGHALVGLYWILVQWGQRSGVVEVDKTFVVADQNLIPMCVNGEASRLTLRLTERL